MLFGLLLVGMACTPESKTRVIAHRGYWQTEGSAQNSIRSLERADEIGVYGAEFDVHYTADNVLVVYHDNDIQGKNIQTSNYEELKDLRLNNGETLPTLESYLKRACDLEVRLVFELKSHATPERNREAARASVEMIKRMGLEKRTDYISFNLDACKEFIRLCPDASVAYLNGELDPDALKEMGYPDYPQLYMVLQKRWEDESVRVHAERVGTAIRHFEENVPEWVNGCRVEIAYGDITGEPYYQDYMGLKNDPETAFYCYNSDGEKVLVEEDGWADADDEPNYLILTFLASSGPAFYGGVGNVLWVDNVKIEM